jgi:hypothetical protein
MDCFLRAIEEYKAKFAEMDAEALSLEVVRCKRTYADERRNGRDQRAAEIKKLLVWAQRRLKTLKPVEVAA